MAVAAAEVMIYNENRKKWQAPDGAEGQISSIQVLHNAVRQTFRIIAIREQDGAWVINCNIHHKLKYHTATPTFHQWRDEQRQVYGLNFSSEKEARDFVSAVGQAIDYLNHQFIHGGDYQVPNGMFCFSPFALMIRSFSLFGLRSRSIITIMSHVSV
ncbi:WH1 domain protein [Cooperia oncophora]